MLYSNLSFPIQSSKAINGIGFPFNNEIVFGGKIGLRLFCPKITIQPGMNDDLVLKYARKGELCIERHIPDWRDQEDPNWNRSEQLFFLLWGHSIEIRLQDLGKIKRWAFVAEDDENYQILELLKANTLIIFKVNYLHPRDTQYILANQGKVQKYWKYAESTLEEFVKELDVPIFEFQKEWVKL